MRMLFLTLLLTTSALAAESVVLGLTSHGAWRACHPMRPDEEICTAEFTEGDQYKLDCEALGGEAVACGCHDYLCIRVSQEHWQARKF